MFQCGTFTVILFLKQQVAVSYISKKKLKLRVDAETLSAH